MNDFFKKVVDVWVHTVPDHSPLGKLDNVDWVKLGVNTAKVAGAAGLTYLGAQLLSIDWGTVAVLAVPITHFVLDYITKLFADHTKDK